MSLSAAAAEASVGKERKMGKEHLLRPLPTRSLDGKALLNKPGCLSKQLVGKLRRIAGLPACLPLAPIQNRIGNSK